MNREAFLFPCLIFTDGKEYINNLKFSCYERQNSSIAPRHLLYKQRRNSGKELSLCL